MGEAKRVRAARACDARQRACGWDADGAPTNDHPLDRRRELHVPSNETRASLDARLAAERAAARERLRVANDALLERDRAERARREKDAPPRPAAPPSDPAPSPAPPRVHKQRLMLNTLAMLSLLALLATVPEEPPPPPPRRRW